MKHLKQLLVVLAVASLTACSGDTDNAGVPLETVRLAPFVETLRAKGELRSAEETPLNVPGSSFESRELVFMVEDGARVEKDQVLARFEASGARKNLSQQELELVRNALKLASTRAQAEVNTAMTQTERAQILGDLALSERYAELDPGASWVSKNELLDKLQDLGLLNFKEDTAEWKIGHQKRAYSADEALSLAQRDGVQASLNRSRDSLAALELRAPHAGVFRLNQNWDGSKIQVGGNAWAGDDFATLPNLERLMARFSLAQSAADGLRVGQRVDVRLSGTGRVIAGKVSRVGSSASVRRRNNPVKFIEFDVAIDSDASMTPGQAVAATVYLVDKAKVLTVPNTALILDPEAEVAAAGTGPAAIAGALADRREGARQDQANPPQRRPGSGQPRGPQASVGPAVVEAAKPRRGSVFDAEGNAIPIVIAQLGSARSEVIQGLAENMQIRVLAPEAPQNTADKTPSPEPRSAERGAP